MKYRKLDADGDMQFGHGAVDFYSNVPEAVAQACVTRLRLWTGHWFLDIGEGTDWLGQVLGTHSRFTADLELRSRIAGTTGLTSIERYVSRKDGEARSLSVGATINTAYGAITFAAPVSVYAPPVPAGQVLGALLGYDGDVLMGPDGQILVGAADPSILVYT